jgi:sugar O-acyltransferase (sialic acid O-acetyltransferase NeuD family)
MTWISWPTRCVRRLLPRRVDSDDGMTPIVILGTGGNCIDILDTINDVNRVEGSERYRCVGFLDDERARWGKEIHGVKVLGPLACAAGLRDCSFVNGLGSSSNFWRKSQIIATTGVPLERFQTIVHPSAQVSRLSRLGPGTVVFQHVTITSNVQVGAHVIILPATVISHDDVIGDYTCIAGGACVSGCVEIGHSCYLGTNAAIRDRCTIGERCLVGMGSVVVASVPRNSVVAGNPARFLRPTVPEEATQSERGSETPQR